MHLWKFYPKRLIHKCVIEHNLIRGNQSCRLAYIIIYNRERNTYKYGASQSLLFLITSSWYIIWFGSISHGSLPNFPRDLIKHVKGYFTNIKSFVAKDLMFVHIQQAVCCKQPIVWKQNCHHFTLKKCRNLTCENEIQKNIS